MDKEIYIHPIFDDLLNNFRFFLVGINMMSMPDFQKALINGHKGERSELEISVKYDDLKCLKYDVRDIFNSFNKEVGLKIDGTNVTCDIRKLINFQARQVAISLSDILQFSKFQNYIVENNASIFKFAKHIRNGAAHNNKFCFNKKAKAELPIMWRDKIIDESFHLEKTVFNEFLAPADLVLLASDISEIIKNYK